MRAQIAQPGADPRPGGAIAATSASPLASGISTDLRMAKYRQWQQVFVSALQPEVPASGGQGNRVRSYAEYLRTHEGLYEPLLPSEADAALQACAAYRGGHAQLRIEGEVFEPMLQRMVRLLGDYRNLHLGAIVPRVGPEGEPGFIRKLYALCDRVWGSLVPDVDYCIWNVLLKRDGEGLPVAYSMSWHYDVHYPRRYFKILIGLNDAAEHGGGTELLSAAGSEAFTNATGYVGNQAANRISDETFHAAAPSPPALFRPNLGDALLFWPSRVLHRGLVPTRQRLMLFVSGCPIPKSLSPQREAITRLAFANARQAGKGYDIPIVWERAAAGTASAP